MLEMMMVNNNKLACWVLFANVSWMQILGGGNFQPLTVGKRTIFTMTLLRLTCVGKYVMCWEGAVESLFNDSNSVSKSHFKINRPSYRSVPLGESRAPTSW